MAPKNGTIRKPTVHFNDVLPTASANGRQNGGPELGRQFSKESNDEEASNNNRCSNKIFIAILLAIIVLAIGAIAITLILVLTRDGEQSFQSEPKQIIIFGDDHCVDLAHNCRENIGLCNNEFYRGMMAIYCRKSCGLCATTPNMLFCADKAGFASRCLSWKRNGFCENSFWPESTRREYCAKTCGFC